MPNAMYECIVALIQIPVLAKLNITYTYIYIMHIYHASNASNNIVKYIFIQCKLSSSTLIHLLATTSYACM